MRSRKVSAADTSSATTSKGKGKSKQVEFSNEVQVKSPQASVLECQDEESELTDLADLEKSSKRASPNVSPRRLRSRGRREEEGQQSGRGRSKSSETPEEGPRRIIPMRKAKVKIGNLKEDEEDEEINEEEGDEEEDELQEDEDVEENVDEEVGEDVDNEGEDEDEVEEVDELISSASPTPPPPRGRCSPVRRRLRPRRTQVQSPPSDGDDEGEEGENDDEEDEAEDEEDGADDAGDAEAAEEEEDGREESIVVAPRILRSGKIVGEEEIGEDVVEEDEGPEEDGVDPDEEIDIDAEGETEDSDESMDDGRLTFSLLNSFDPHLSIVDLTVATAKTLVRLRRDDLIRLCETRDLEPVGTKPQLAEALLQWRDRHTNDFSSPSSAGTARPPSTLQRRTNGRRSQTQSGTPPVLLRPSFVHISGPRTPPPVSQNHKEPEPELELDLESLGLEDREIPPEKLTKLEKIGSGSFKDVFIGKFKGRRIAISEFRGQLSESEFYLALFASTGVDILAVDIKELKLLGGFNHPNIVRFVRVSFPS